MTTNRMSFGEAWAALRSGTPVARREWSPGTFLLIREDPKLDYVIVDLYIPGSGRVTWSPTQRELFSDDWMTASPPPQHVMVQGALHFGAMGEK